MAILPPRYLFFFALQFLSVYGTDILIATVPNLVRAGDTETVLVTIQKASGANPRNVPVTVSFKNADNTVIDEVTMIIQEAANHRVNSGVALVHVNPENVVGNEQNHITVTVTCDTLGFSQDKNVHLSFEGGFFFIQTDKPIYTPTQTVKMRLISLNKRLSPVQQEIRLDIRTPQDIVVERKDIRANSVTKGVHTNIFPLPDEPMFGNWSIVAYYGKDMESNRTVQFEVKEYVLPTFYVDILPGNYISRSNETIKVEVNARYVYDKPVRGRSILKIGVIDPDGEIELKGTDILPLNDGVAAHDIDINILGANWFDEYLGYNLYLETTVWEEATGHFENASDSSTKIVNGPYIFNRERTMQYFKLGLPFQVKTDLKYTNGRPAPNVPVRVVAIAQVSDGSQRSLRNDPDENGAAGIITDNTDNNGQVNFNLYVPTDCTEIVITLTTENADLRMGDNANLEFRLEPHESPGSEYLVIRPPLQETEIRLGNRLNIDTHMIRRGQGDLAINLLIISRGKIVHDDSKVVRAADGNTHGFDFAVTPEMVPSSRIVAYFVGQDNIIISDSVKVQFKRECNNQISVGIEGDQTPAPNALINLLISSKPDTVVSLIAVDEAVLRLRDFHRLTRDKMYSTMDMHDIGCGPGGGRNAEDIFKNAGVTVMVSHGPLDVGQREGAHCVSKAVSRRRRSLEELLEEFGGGDERKELSCRRGHRGLGSGSCTEKAERFRTLLVTRYPDISEEDQDESVEIFIECCERAESVDASRERSDGFDFANFENINVNQQVDIRKDFRESWAFDDIHVDSNEPVIRQYTLPGSITTWSIQAFGLNDDFSMCIIEPTQLIVSRKLFIQLKMPYSVIRNEHVEIQATVFNYGKDDLAIRMFLKTSPEVCSQGTPNVLSAKQEFTVARNDAYTITYVVIGVEVGEWPINVVIISTSGSDGVTKKLNVIAEGIEKTFYHSVTLNPHGVQVDRRRRDVQVSQNCEWDADNQAQLSCLDISLPPTVVPGTESCYISMTGTPLGPAITAVVSGLGRWIRQPTGCGEQTMIRLAPNVYVLKYLRATESGSENDERNALENIKSGVVREMTYRHPDGSFAAFQSYPSSTWLTAFVAKVFCQASQLTPVDARGTCGAIEWITHNRQRSNGAFYEGHSVIHREMTGGVNGDIAMTAFALIAMSECSCDQQAAMGQAQNYLEGQLDGIEKPFTIAIVTYALALVGSDRRFDANTKLKSHSSEDPATHSRFWGADSPQRADGHPYWYQRRVPALAIETTGYALLAQTALGEYAYAGKIASWLANQQNYDGGFQSTQDTVIALQSLSEHSAINTGGDLDLHCNITAPSGFKTILWLDNEDILLQKKAKIPKDHIQGRLLVETQGEGVGTLNVEVKYNEISQDTSETCPFDMEITSVRVNRDQPGGEEIQYIVGDRLRITIDVSYLGESKTSMAIIDVGLFTGFVPDKASCLQVVAENILISRYEASDRSVIFYADYIPVQRNGSISFEFMANCHISVRNIHHAAVNVYDYYSPDEKCTKFYHGEGSNIVMSLCSDGDEQCTCLSSECPPCDNRDMSSEDLLIAACVSAQTYVFKLQVEDIQIKDGYKVISAMVLAVLKKGDEQDIFNGESRKFWVSNACRCPEIRVNKPYLIIGSNSLKYTIPQGNAATVGYRYVIDNTAIVKRWRRKLDREFQVPMETGQTRCQ